MFESDKNALEAAVGSMIARLIVALAGHRQEGSRGASHAPDKDIGVAIDALREMRRDLRRETSRAARKLARVKARRKARIVAQEKAWRGTFQAVRKAAYARKAEAKAVDEAAKAEAKAAAKAEAKAAAEVAHAAAIAAAEEAREARVLERRRQVNGSSCREWGTRTPCARERDGRVCLEDEGHRGECQYVSEVLWRETYLSRGDAKAECQQRRDWASERCPRFSGISGSPCAKAMRVGNDLHYCIRNVHHLGECDGRPSEKWHSNY